MNIQLTTAHEVLPDASSFSDILGPETAAGASFGDRTLRFLCIRLPPLKVKSGSITASDGYILIRDPFTQQVSAGDYPMTLAVAIIDNDQGIADERIAFAQVRFSSKPAVRWSLALVPGQDPLTLKPDEIFGYPVDSGTGCFADSNAFEIANAAGQSLAEQMMAESDKVYRHTRTWVSVETEAGSMAAFSSGYGDGVYASYFGHAGDGELVSLVTDFGLAKWAESP